MKLLLIAILIPILTSCILDESGRSADEVMSNHSDDTFEPTPTPTIAIPERPTGALTINDSFCSCINQTSDFITSVCDSYCSGAPNSTTPTLYGSVTPGLEVTQNALLGNLYNWCTVELLNELGEGDASPTCSFRVTDDINTVDLPIVIPSGGNSFTVNLSTLETNKVYKGHIVETVSGAISDIIQIQRKDQDDDSDTLSGPLQIMPMSQYSCLTRSGSISTGGDEFYDQALRLHYYYASNEDPDALPPTDNMTICHDPRLPGQGDNDNPLYPRFELVEHAFYVWNKSDLRFYDINPTNGILDVNDIIKDNLYSSYGITQTISIFQEFKWPNGPLATEPISSGYFLQPWIDTSTGRGFCPGYEHFISGDPLFAVLRDVLGGIETEGIFLALRQATTMIDNSTGEEITAPDDILIIRESDLEQVWFYYENSTYYTPTEITAGQKTIRFYYPFDTSDPWVQKSHQKLYTVKAPEDISSSTSTSSSGLRTSITAPDKRFGCVPKHGL